MRFRLRVIEMGWWSGICAELESVGCEIRRMVPRHVLSGCCTYAMDVCCNDGLRVQRGAVQMAKEALMHSAGWTYAMRVV